MIKISREINQELIELLKTDKSIVIDCLIINDEGKVFAQKRSSDRKKFPNCWDLPGGSLEKGESAIDCIQRELQEELEFELTEITKVSYVHEFELPIEMRKDGEDYQLRMIQVVVKVKDYSNPVLEFGKVSEYDWFDKDNVDTLMEGREDTTDTYIKDAVLRVL